MNPEMVQYLIAIWDYAAEGQFELSFKQGDRIKLLEKHNDDWLVLSALIRKSVSPMLNCH